ncbi:MAG: TonB-dependent hemoglobin/transferrin/lactoferrin family receptor [Sneathiella sp.]|nr:TonB-dependent hemoglobin/transferrin/lactoferrin family receptor [Sneathiella sp.]
MSCVPFAAALLSTTLLTSVSAEETDASSTLDAITVYATRSAQSTFKVPGMVSTVDPEAPGTALSSDIDDLLKMVPGVDVVNGPRRNGQTVTIRGFDSEAIITLIDGRRQNFEAVHDGRFYLDPALLKKIEIVKGAASSIYGGGGIGGVVAFETKDASDILKPGENFGTTTSMGYRSANEELSSTITSYGRADNLDVLASISFRSSDDIRVGGGDELATEDNLISTLLKAGVTAADWHTVKLQYQASNNNGIEPNNGAGSISSSNPLLEKEVSDRQISAKYIYENPDNDWLNLQLHAYANNTSVEEEDISGSNLGRIQVRELTTLGFTADNQSRFDYSDAHSQTISYGLEVYQDTQEGTSTSTGDGTRPGVPNAEALSIGVYVQDEIKFDTGIGEFLIIPAARFDNYRSDDETGNSQNESAISPKLALSYIPNDNLVFFGSLAQAFRAPNMTELYPSGLHFPGGGPVPDNFFVPNPDLKPETVTTLEIGSGIRFKGLVSDTDKLRLKGAWHMSRGTDFITQEVDVFGGTTETLNIDKAKLWGWEVEAEYRFQPVTAKFGASYVEAENGDTGEYLANNVPLTFTSDISYDISEVSSIVGWRAKLVDANDKVGTGDVASSGYAVHDIYYRYAPADGTFQNLTLDFGIENIFDKRYSKRFATLPEEGRNFAARVSYKW